MKKNKKVKSRVDSFLYNHLWLKYSIDYGGAFLASVISAALFAFGIVCFLNPVLMPGQHTLELVSGGSSGLSQVVASILRICGVKVADGDTLFFSFAYLIINIPLIILAFKGIGVRFAIFTLVNVGCVFIFSNFFRGTETVVHLATLVNNNGGFVARALFAGFCTGLSSAIAFKFDTSAGGFDILSYYVALRKSSTIGRYGILLNSCVIASFYLITGFTGVGSTVPGFESYSSWAVAISGPFFSVIYLFTVMLIVDAINIRNKKVQVEINTTNEELPRLLIAHVPHGVTTVKAKGAYSGQDRLLVYIIISSLELNTVMSLVKEIDPSAFVNVKALQQVFGRFFTKPIR